MAVRHAGRDADYETLLADADEIDFDDDIDENAVADVLYVGHDGSAQGRRRTRTAPRCCTPMSLGLWELSSSESAT